MTLTIEPGDQPSWKVESSYAIHPDKHISSGIVKMVGKGAAYSSSSKPKLNTKSTTEAKFVDLDDYMAQVLWTRHFLAAHGMYIPVTTIYQDKKVPYYWQRMAEHPAAGKQDTWI